MLNFGASKPRVRGGPGPRGPPLDPRLLLQYWITSEESLNFFPDTANERVEARVIILNEMK